MVSILPRALARRVKDVNESGGSPDLEFVCLQNVPQFSIVTPGDVALEAHLVAAWGQPRDGDADLPEDGCGLQEIDSFVQGGIQLSSSVNSNDETNPSLHAELGILYLGGFHRLAVWTGFRTALRPMGLVTVERRAR
jgi:hypothetical protein